MEKLIFDNNIKVFYVEASSFPEGIKDAHNEIHALVPSKPERKYFGLSKPDKNGQIHYKAAAEELKSGEAKEFHCKTLTLKKGEYNCIIVPDYANDVIAIQKAFEKLTSSNEIDPQGYCIEWYHNQRDVKCLIKLKEKSNK